MRVFFCFSLLRGETKFVFVPLVATKDVEEFKVHGRSVLAYDLGGHKSVRDVWKDYLVSSGCIVFVVDASDTERFADAKAELDVRIAHRVSASVFSFLLLDWPLFFFSSEQALLSDEDLWGVPFVVFGNKCDVDCSVSESELRDALGLAYRQTRPIDVFMCSAINRYGYNSGMGWVSAFF